MYRYDDCIVYFSIADFFLSSIPVKAKGGDACQGAAETMVAAGL